MKHWFQAEKCKQKLNTEYEADFRHESISRTDCTDCLKEAIKVFKFDADQFYREMAQKRLFKLTYDKEFDMLLQNKENK